MKKVAFIIILLFTVFGISVNAQESIISESIQLGTAVPDFDIHILTNEGTTKQSIKDFRGKVVILEFWATYCGPCIPAMEHLNKIQQKLHNELVVISITDEDRAKVVSFLNKRPTTSLVALDHDKKLNSLFYHQFMPHTILIDPNGVLKAITSPDEITEEVIYLAKSGAEIVLKTKAEFATQEQALSPVVVDDKSFYKVAISPSKEGTQSQINKKSETEYDFVNCTVPMMYQILYQTSQTSPNEKACLEVTEQTKYLLQENHQYCFSLKVPDQMKNRLGEIGMRHLEEVFAVKPQFEARTRKVYALVINEKDKLITDSTTNGNITIKDFLKLLWDTRLVDMPIVNESGIPDETVVNVQMPKQVNEVSESLTKLGFHLEPKTKETGCLVLYETEKDVKKNF